MTRRTYDITAAENIFIKKDDGKMKPLGTMLSHKLLSIALRDCKGDLTIALQYMYEAYEREKQNTLWVSSIQGRLNRLELEVRGDEYGKKRICEKP